MKISKYYKRFDMLYFPYYSDENVCILCMYE